MTHGGPTANALDRARPRASSSSPAAASPSSTSTTAAAPATAATTASGSTASGASSTSTTASPARATSPSRGDVDPERLAIAGGSAGGYTTLAALAFRDVFAAGISLLRDRRPGAPRRATPTSSSRATSTAWSARTRRGRAATASARRSTTVDEISLPGPRPPGRRGPGRAAGPGRGDRRRAGRQRHPARLPRVRGRGPRLPRRGRPSPARSRRELSFLGQVFGFEPADDSSRSRLPGLDAWREHRRAAPSPMATVAAARRGPSTGSMEHQPDRARPRPARRGRRARPTSPAGSASPYPILLLLGGLVLGFLPGLPDDRARARPGVPAVPAADPVRGRLLHPDPRLQGEPPGDRAAGDRARPVHDGRRRARRPGRRCPGLRAGGRLRPSGRSSRRPTRSRPRPSSSGSGVPRRVVTILEGESLSTTPRRSSPTGIGVAVALGGVVLARRGRPWSSSSSASAAIVVGAGRRLDR